MTKVIFNIDKNDVYVDCTNHAGDHDACTIVSTLMNVLVAKCMMCHKPINKYEGGRVFINTHFSDPKDIDVFEAVKFTLEKAAEEYPDSIKIY